MLAWAYTLLYKDILNNIFYAYAVTKTSKNIYNVHLHLSLFPSPG